MDREKKIGIILIVIGICIPLAVLPFVSGYSKEKGIFGSLYDAGIPIGKDKQAIDQGKDSPSPSKELEGKTINFSKLVPKRIPFRFSLVFTLIFFYMGIIRIDRARRKAAERPTGAAEPEDDSAAIKPE